MNPPEYILKNGNPDSHYSYVEFDEVQSYIILKLCNRYSEAKICEKKKLKSRTYEGIIQAIYRKMDIEPEDPAKVRKPEQIVEWANDRKLVCIYTNLIKFDIEEYYLNPVFHVSNVLQTAP